MEFNYWYLFISESAANDTLTKLNMVSSPDHLFLSTLTHNNAEEKINTFDELSNWMESINI